jgi:hypothetical protein
MHTTLPAQPIAAENLDLAAIADRVDLAAALIERDGLEHGDLWDTGLLLDYRDGVACSADGALAVVCGYRNARQAEAEFFGTDVLYLDADQVPSAPHPVLAAVMAEMCCVRVEELFDWSDSARPDQVVARLRQVAAAFRLRVAS